MKKFFKFIGFLILIAVVCIGSIHINEHIKSVKNNIETASALVFTPIDKDGNVVEEETKKDENVAKAEDTSAETEETVDEKVVVAYMVGDGTTKNSNAIKKENIRDIVIPAEYKGLPVVKIGQYAFAESKIEHITIPDCIKTIENHAFYNAVRFNTFNTRSVETIGESAFDKTAIKDITLGAGLKKIGNSAFAHNSFIENLIVESNQIEDLQADNNVFALTGRYGNCKITFGDAVERVPAYMFMPTSTMSIDTGFKFDTIEFNNVKEIGNCAFAGCSYLINFNLDKVEKIGKSAFALNFVAENIVLNGAKNIEIGAFRYWEKLKTVFISKDVLKILGSDTASQCVFAPSPYDTDTAVIFYTDAETLPEGWASSNFTYKDSNGEEKFSLVYNTTYEDYLKLISSTADANA